MSATNPTFGEVRFQCQKSWPGVDPDILDSYLNERYRRVLRKLPWQRLRVQAVLQTVAPYTTGTLDVANGSTALTLTDGTFSADMSGRAIRIAAGNEYYQFTYASPTAGTLDRGYEGTTDAVATFSIWQNIYVLPADLRILHSMRVLGAPWDMDQISQEQLDEQAPHRGLYGTPSRYATHMDDASTPPRRQVELYPIPDAVLAIPFWYTQDPTLFAASSTASFFAPWLIPDVLYAGVEAEALGKEKDYAGADRAELRFAQVLAEMLMEEARRIGPRRLKMAEKYTRHNRQRWSGTAYPKDP